MRRLSLDNSYSAGLETAGDPGSNLSFAIWANSYHTWTRCLNACTQATQALHPSAVDKFVPASARDVRSSARLQGRRVGMIATD